MDYFKKLQELLKIERADDHLQYQKQVENAPLSERRANGLTWYPLAIRGSELGRGDYLTVELERTTHHGVPHQFRNGMPAIFFSNHDPKNDRVEGVISFQHDNRLKLTLKTDELPSWSRDGKLGIDLLFDDNSYDEMFAAIKIASQTESAVVEVLTGNKVPTFQDKSAPFFSDNLNNSQQKAVEKIISANEFAVVHGPPGTGKTTTLLEAIYYLATQRNEKILVVAPSNTAVDLLAEKLFKKGLNVVRVGNPARVSDDLLALTLDSRMNEHQQMKDTKRLKKQAREYKNMAHKYKREFGKSERDQRKALFDEAHKIMKEIASIENYISEDILEKAQVVAATLVGANHYTVRALNYSTVFIDEAGQALEPACWIPILKAKKVVLAGDYFQLSPTIKSKEAAKNGLEKTLLEKCAERTPEAVALLEEQYRMNSKIMAYSSEVFYKNRLLAHASVANRTLFLNDNPVLFIDTAGCSYEEKLEGTSSTNAEEAAFLVKQLIRLVEDIHLKNNKNSFPSIAVISPYKQQLVHLQGFVDESEVLNKVKNKISVNTIDSFQGQERDIVFISLVRSNTSSEIGFLSDIRRMNVAMTRARKKLVVIGDSATLGSHLFYANFIEYTQRIGSYQSAWELMD